MAANRPRAEPSAEPRRVLIVDNDDAVSEVVEAILTDEGYAVTALTERDHESIASAVGQVEPDCILLDGAGDPGFGGSWSEAQYLSNRARVIPTVMFSAHAEAVREARQGESERASAAAFAAIVGKPFGLDELLEAVETATGRSVPFDRSEEAERGRTAELVAQLRAAGATDIHTSNRREWATFTSPADGRTYQLYWWQRLGRYVLGRYDEDARLELIGHYFERADALAAALGT